MRLSLWIPLTVLLTLEGSCGHGEWTDRFETFTVSKVSGVVLPSVCAACDKLGFNSDEKLKATASSSVNII